ncbi:MAG: phosphoenolpyruvate synthase [Candidatus Lambdaproteobacteria bacterium]|nr:phosphoenolpyruvate synthase [Candidatus Lambdaproteobacteria bacterium]
MASKSKSKQLIYWFSDLGIKDVPIVGGKNASLGEMFANLTEKGVRVPDGYAISAYAYEYYVDSSGIRGEIERLLKALDRHNLAQLAETGGRIRELIRSAPLPADLEQAIKDAYDELCRRYGTQVDTAVRSSATAEDLPDASFAGQQDTYLNVKGYAALLQSCRNCFASLFTDRAIAYREEKQFDHFSVALSIAVQKMVRSDLAAAGVMFSIDTESGFKDAVYVTAGYGLGENVVQGSINPDEWYVHKPTLHKGHRSIIYAHLGEKQQKMIYVDPSKGKGTANVPVPQAEREKFCLTEDEVLVLSKWACIIEEHYSAEAGYYKPMDMEWAKDGQSGDLFIVQARPETVISRRETGVIRRIVLEKTSKELAQGMAVGDNIGTGPAHVIKSAKDIESFKQGEVLVTEMTDPDWVPIMKIASAIVTDQGGRTCHAAIISRELGIPCIVGTGSGSRSIPGGKAVTVSCAGGSKGVVYEGVLPFKEETIRIEELEMPKVKMMFQQSDSDRAFPESRYPIKGIGLLRMDELIRDEVKLHPLAARDYANWKKNGENEAIVKQIDEVSRGYPDKSVYFVNRLSQGIGQIAAAVYPKPVHVLLPDSPTRQLDALIGGKQFSYGEANPMLGLRGAARFHELDYEEAFKLEVSALARARNEMGLDNIAVVVPGAQSAREADTALELLADAGLQQGQQGLAVLLLCRTPAQAMVVGELADKFDGFILDVGETAQLAQGMDRSNTLLEFYSERHPAVVQLVTIAVSAAKKARKPMGLTNIAPGNLKFFAEQPAFKKASYVAVRPDVFMEARQWFLEAEGAA